MTTSQRIPTHLIAGPLGVGKTTTILDYLKHHAKDEFTAVLVNDFGPVGLDSSIIDAQAPRPNGTAKTLMIPGGCICCSAASGMIAALREIVSWPNLSRIIVEPSGLTLLGQMVDLLREAARELPLEIRPVITLLDPRALTRPGFTSVPYFLRMIEATDILVANRSDLATPDQIAAFQSFVQNLYPPKLRVLTTHHGQLPAEVFSLTDPRTSQTEISAAFSQITQLDTLTQHEHGNILQTAPRDLTHAADHFPNGLAWEAEKQIPENHALATLNQLAAHGLNGIPIARLKAILHTSAGWQIMEIACGQVFVRNTDYRRDNRLDWISHGQPIAPETMGALLNIE